MNNLKLGIPVVLSIVTTVALLSAGLTGYISHQSHQDWRIERCETENAEDRQVLGDLVGGVAVMRAEMTAGFEQLGENVARLETAISDGV